MTTFVTRETIFSAAKLNVFWGVGGGGVEVGLVSVWRHKKLGFGPRAA